jgi:hypothetical protein
MALAAAPDGGAGALLPENGEWFSARDTRVDKGCVKRGFREKVCEQTGQAVLRPL